MKDYSELKMLADACPPPGTYHYQSKEWSNLMAFQAEVEDIYESDVGMAKELIDEVNRLKAEVESLKKDAARFRFIEQDASSGMSNIYGDEWVSVIDSIINEDNNK